MGTVHCETHMCRDLPDEYLFAYEVRIQGGDESNIERRTL